MGDVQTSQVLLRIKTNGKHINRRKLHLNKNVTDMLGKSFTNSIKNFYDWKTAKECQFIIEFSRNEKFSGNNLKALKKKILIGLLFPI